MYTSHLGVYRTSLVKELEGLRSEYDGCQDYDFTMRVAEKTKRVAHIPKILYHWRQREGSTALNPEAKDYVKEATLKAKKAAIERRGLNADVEWIPEIYQYRINYRPLDNPLVSIIIPSKDNPEILTQCLDSLTKITNYRNYEIIVVDNGSSDENREKYQSLLDAVKKEDINAKYLYAPRDFNFSFMCNIGAKSSSGDYLLFLNDDIEIIQSEWLERMLGQAELTHVGAVGAKLLYPDTTLIQHDGVISIESGPVHYFTRQDDSVNYYFNRNRLDFNVSAVTAACLLVKREAFENIGGFNEELAVAYNDIDLCYRLTEQGLYNVIRNDAILYHHESISRGDDTMDDAKFERLMSEQEKLYDAHPEYKKKDPYYNENLSQIASDFSFNIDFDADYSVETYDTMPEFQEDETIHFGIDSVVHDWCFYVEGWAFRRGEEDNQYLDPKLVLEGEKIYIISTRHVKREDVAETFPDDEHIEYSGFKLRVARKAVPAGEYRVRILVNNRISTLREEDIQKIVTGGINYGRNEQESDV